MNVSRRSGSGDEDAAGGGDTEGPAAGIAAIALGPLSTNRRIPLSAATIHRCGCGSLSRVTLG